MTKFAIKSYLKNAILEDLKEDIKSFSRVIVKEYRRYARKHGLSFKVKALDKTGFRHGIDVYHSDKKYLFFLKKKLLKSDVTTLDFYFEENKDHFLSTPYEIAKQFGDTAIKALVYSLLNIQEMYKNCKVSNPRMLEECSRYYSLLILWMIYTESGKVEIENSNKWYEKLGIPECYFKYSHGIFIDHRQFSVDIGIRGDVCAIGNCVSSSRQDKYK